MLKIIRLKSIKIIDLKYYLFKRKYYFYSITIKQNDMITCARCGGSGILSHYMHIDAGVCFACNGAGKVKSLPKSKIKVPYVAPEFMESAEKIANVLKTGQSVNGPEVVYSNSCFENSFSITDKNGSHGTLLLGLALDMQERNFIYK